MLKKLSPLHLHILRDVFTQNWPENLVSHQLLTHFIEMSEKYPKVFEKLHVLSDRTENFSADGSFVALNGNRIHFDTFQNNPHDRMVKMMCSLDFANGPKMFVNFKESFRPLLSDIQRYLNLEVTSDECGRLIKFKSDKENYRKFIKDLPSDFKITSLTLDDIPLITSTINHSSNANYINYLKHVIEINPTTALFHNSSLVAWCAQADTGEMSNMVVHEDYQRRQIGVNLFSRHVIKLIEMEKIPFGFVDFWNEKSYNMCMKIEGEWIGNFSCFGVKKKEWSGKPHENWYQA